MEHKFLRKEGLAIGMWTCCSAPKERYYLCLYLKLEYVCACRMSCQTLCDPMDVALQALLSGILQARILEWVAISFSSRSFEPGIKPMFPALPALAGGFFNSWATGEFLNQRIIQYWSDIHVAGLMTVDYFENQRVWGCFECVKWVQEKVCGVRTHGCNSGNLRLGQGEGRGAGDKGIRLTQYH